MKKIFGVLLAVMAILFVGNLNSYAGCGGLSTGMLYEAGDFHYTVVRGDEYGDSYESEVSAHTTSFTSSGSWDFCYNNVSAGAPYAGDITIPASSTGTFNMGYMDFTTVGVGEKAFADCPTLNSVTIPNTVRYVSDSAFARSTYLQNVEFGNGVITLGNGIFKGCYSLRSVTFKGAVPYGLSASQFSECVNLETIYVPCNKINLFRNALGNNFNIVTESPYHYNITSSMPNAGSVNVSDFDCSSNSITISASPNPGWEFSSWSDGNTTNPRTIVLTSDVSLSASFIQEGHHFVYSLDLTSQATSISDWTIMDATQNPSYSDEAVGKYAYDVYGGIESESYVTSNPDISFKYRNSSDKQKAFCIYPGNCFEFNGKNGILSIKNTLAGDRILITCAAKGSMMASFADDYSGYPLNAVAITEDLTLPAKGSSGADEQGYTWREIEFESLGGDVEIKEVNAGYRVKKVEVIRSNNYTVTANASPANAGSVNVVYSSNHSQATMTATANSGYHFEHWNDGNTQNPRTITLTQDVTCTAYFVDDAIPTYTVTANVYPVDAGSVNVVYSSNHSQATMTAIGNTGYHFKRWNGGNTENPRTVVLTQDTSFTAIFELNEVYVTYIGMDGKNLGVETVAYGKSAKQTGIDADEFGYTLTGWDKDLSSVTENMTVTASYTRDAINGFYYIFDRENRTAVLDREGNSYAKIKTLNVPNHFIYRGIHFAVVAVGANAFEGCTRLTDVVLPSNVEDVFESAFSGCSDMVHLTVSAGLRSIADYAFNGCKRLEDITVYAERVPDLTATSFNAVGNKKYINVYVPDNRVNNYKRDDYWSEFNIVVKSAEIVEGTVENVAVQPEETTAQFTWPTESSAGSYTIQITKDGEVFCTLIFNANGQLTGIAFAPGRDGNRAPAATMTANGGMQFTVTGLDAGTTYAYTVTTKDTNERVIATYEGSFETNGTMEDGIENVQTSVAPKKVVRDGQIYILRGEKVFTLQGVEVK